MLVESACIEVCSEALRPSASVIENGEEKGERGGLLVHLSPQEGILARVGEPSKIKESVVRIVAVSSRLCSPFESRS